MIRLVTFSTLLIGSVLVYADTDAVNIDTLNLEAKTLTKQFGSQLKSVLKSSMKASGPVKSIQACNVSAPEIAQSISGQSGWKVARTSSKLRNQNNKPDLWEAAVLAEWEQQQAKGVPAKNLSKSEIVEMDGAQVYRFMKAIPAGDICLKCHGEKLSDPVQQALKKLYPDDQAVGYKKGDIRGAFTLQKSL